LGVDKIIKINMENELSNWGILKKFLKIRRKNPWKHPSFVIYFFSVIVIVGSIGFSSEIIVGLKNCCFNISGLTTNAANIFIALIAASSVELILINEDELDTPYRKNDIQVFGIASLVIGFLIWMLAMYFKEGYWGLGLSLLGLFFSFYFWWISNAGNKILTDSTPSGASVGGGIQTTRDQLDGDTSKFTS
jgi:hypothetical protein